MLTEMAKMKVDLKDAAYYGEWDSEEDSWCDVHAWFEKSSFKFFYTSNLIDKFGYKDCVEIKESGYFIPVFKTDVIALQKEFIATYHDKQIEETMNTIIENDNYGYDSGYEVAFRILTQDYPQFAEFSKEYFNYEKQKRLQDAKIWCRKNNIPYYSHNDPERILDLRDTLPWAFGTARHNGNDCWIPIPLWFCRNNCEIIVKDKIEAEYGYKTDEQIILSGNFVPMFKVSPDEIEEEYFQKHNTPETEIKINEFLKQNKDYTYEEAFWEMSDYEDWHKYRSDWIFEVAKQWCAENNIPYYISKDEPDHLGSNLTNKQNGVL